MVYCYECGEQVAENDVFCPYCGITLPSSVVETKEEDALPSNSAPIADTSSVSDSATQKSDFTNDVTAENINVSEDDFSIPAEIPQIDEPETEIDYAPRFGQQDDLLAQFPQTGGETVKTFDETPNFDAVPERPRVLEEAEPLNQKIGEEIPSEPIFVEPEIEYTEPIAPDLPQNESSLMDYGQAEIKEIPSAEEPEKSIDDIAADPLSSNFDIDAFDAKSSSSIDDYNEDYEMEQAFAALEPPTENKEAINVAVVVEKPIDMPSADLPAEEQFPPSRFDSVSIMEKSAPEAEKESIIEPPTPAVIVPTVETPPVAENKSFTQPNLVGSDTDGKRKQKLQTLDEGTVLNSRYEIVRKIGGGGMGAVYLASDKNLGGVLRAVKEMVQSYIEEEQQDKAVNDFKRESLLLTSLDHQSIPTIYDYFFDEKEARFYLVMKYISGGDLSSRLRSAPTGRIDEAEVTKWAVQLTDVLDYLHNRQPPIVYRDLKPANIMVDSNSGRTMLIDFGIARWVNKEEKGVTAVGTMGYAPPELFSGNVEARSDIYSLGSTMFHLLTGADPQSNPLLIFDFQKNPRPRQINPQLSDQMERILMRAVEYNADKRFSSAAEMRQALDEHQENLKRGSVTFGVKEAPSPAALSDQPVFCGFCGQKIVATDMFCAFCGAKQPMAQQGVHSESYSPMPLTAQLLIIGTNELEQPAFRLEKEENLVGRRDPQSNIFPEVDLSKYDPQTKISRRHARIWREGNEFMVEDLGSSNGTYVMPVVSDTVRLQPRQPKLLTNGDKIRLGDTTLHFILG